MVSPIVAVKNGIRYCRTCDIKGRSPRSEFWWFTLFIWTILATPIVLSVLSELLIKDRDTSEFVLSCFVILFLILIPFHLYSNFVIGTRRAHDINKKLWLFVFLKLAILLVFITGIYISSSFSNQISNIMDSSVQQAIEVGKSGGDPKQIIENASIQIDILEKRQGIVSLFMLIPFLTLLISLNIIYCFKGTKGPNFYGPDPLAPKSETLADSTISDTTPQN